MNLRLPLVPTVIVAFAVAIMLGLGLWQLDRAREKDAKLRIWSSNPSRLPTAYPASNPTDETYLYRRLSADCLRVVGWQTIGGKSKDGKPGWRHIASCATGAEGPGLIVDMGVSARPDFQPQWTGGPVSGIATHEPDASSWLDRLTGRALPLRLMIVADRPAPGLVATASPDPSAVPNNHRSYMVQWFLFAAIAVVIYALALRGRQRKP